MLLSSTPVVVDAEAVLAAEVESAVLVLSDATVTPVVQAAAVGEAAEAVEVFATGGTEVTTAAVEAVVTLWSAVSAHLATLPASDDLAVFSATLADLQASTVSMFGAGTDGEDGNTSEGDPPLLLNPGGGGDGDGDQDGDGVPGDRNGDGRVDRADVAIAINTMVFVYMFGTETDLIDSYWNLQATFDAYYNANNPHGPFFQGEGDDGEGDGDAMQV